MNDNDELNQFCRQYQAKVRVTDEKFFKQTLMRIYDPNDPYYDPSMPPALEVERMVAIYLPESEASRLIHEINEINTEKVLIDRDYRVRKLYYDYKTYLNLLR